MQDYTIRKIITSQVNYKDRNGSMGNFKFNTGSIFKFDASDNGCSVYSLEKLNFFPEFPTIEQLLYPEHSFTFNVEEIYETVVNRCAVFEKNDKTYSDNYIERDLGITFQYDPTCQDETHNACNLLEHSHSLIHLPHPDDRDTKFVMRQALFMLIEKHYPEYAYSNESIKPKEWKPSDTFRTR